MNEPVLAPMRGPIRRFTSAALLAAVALGAAHADDRALEAARIDHEAGHYRHAFDRLAVLADSGHCEAARFAREMVRHGPRLYATRFEVAAERLARWQAVPRCDARAAAPAVVAAP